MNKIQEQIESQINSCKSHIVNFNTLFKEQKITKHFTNCLKMHIKQLFQQIIAKFEQNFQAKQFPQTEDFLQKFLDLFSKLQSQLEIIYLQVKTLEQKKFFDKFGEYIKNYLLLNSIQENFNSLTNTLLLKFSLQELQNYSIKINPKELTLYFTQPYYQILDKLADDVQIIVTNNKSTKDIPELRMLTSELTAFFWLKYFHIESTISWQEFSIKFSEFIEQLESQLLSPKQLTTIREYIDEDYDNLITVEALQSFLDLVWCNPQDRNQVLELEFMDNEITQKAKKQNDELEPVNEKTIAIENNDSQQQSQQIQQQSQEQQLSLKYKLKNQDKQWHMLYYQLPASQLNQRKLLFKVIEIPSKTYFSLNQQFEIIETGYNSQQNKNYRADGVVLFGRKTEKIPALADLYFYTDDKQVSRKQFQIVFKQNIGQFFIQCTSPSNPTMFKINQGIYEIEKNSIIQLGAAQYFRVQELTSLNELTESEQPQVLSSIEHTLRVRELQQAQFLQQLQNHSSFMPMKIKLFEDDNTQNKEITEKKIEQVIQDNNIEPTLPLNKMQSLQNDVNQELGQPSQTMKRYKSAQIQSEIVLILKPLKGEFKKNIVLRPNLKQKETIFIIGKQNNAAVRFQTDVVDDIQCQIIYNRDLGVWGIGEKIIPEQKNYSSKGTFLFMKNYQQFSKKMPSKSFLLEENMQFGIENTFFEVIQII